MSGKGENKKNLLQSKAAHERLALNHYIAKDEMGGALLRTPVDTSRPLKVLDSGTGDGTWLLDLASSLPTPLTGAHEFVGSDINPEPFPESPPANVKFVVQDINKPWPGPELDQYDVVHQRMTFYAAGPNPSGAIANLQSIIKPGGWIQLVEASMDFPPDLVNPEKTPAFLDMMKLVRSIANTTGTPHQLAKELGSLLEKAGFTDIGEEDVHLRFGRTNKDEKLGRDGVRSCLLTVQGITGFAQSLPPEKQLIPQERYATLEADLEKELTEVGAVFPLKFVWGRKPA